MRPPRPYAFWRDALWWLGCVAYAANRWVVKPRVTSPFLHGQFNDLWLIPCALPPVLWAHRFLRLRADDAPPRWGEIVFHLVLWSVLFEWIGPHLMNVTGDVLDVAAYCAGGLAAGLWWSRAGRP